MQKKKNAFCELKVKFVSFICLFFYFVSYVLASAAPVYALDSQSLSLQNMSIPGTLGTIHEVYPGNAKGPAVILLQDAHGRVDVQKKIIAMLEELGTQSSFATVLAEGSEGKCDLDLFQSYPLEDERLSVIEKFVSDGSISAPEAYVIDNAETELYGIEDERSYLEHVRLCSELLLMSDQVNAFASELDTRINFAADAVFSGDVKELYLKRRSYMDESSVPLEYFRYLVDLSQKHDIQFSSYKYFLKLKEIMRFQKNIDLDSIQKETSKIIDVLLQDTALPDSLIEKMASAQLDFQSGAISSFTFYAELKSICLKMQLDFRDYKNVNLYYSFLRLFEDLDVNGFDAELRKLEKSLLGKVCVSDKEKKLFAFFKEIERTIRLITLRLEPFEYDLSAASISIEKIESVFTENGCAPFSANERSLFGSVYPKALQFYELAHERDEILVRNIMKYRKKSRDEILPVVTGGYHTRGIMGALRAAKVPFAVLSPNVSEGTGRDLYENIMKRSASFFGVREGTRGGTVAMLSNLAVYDSSILTKQNGRAVLKADVLSAFVSALDNHPRKDLLVKRWNEKAGRHIVSVSMGKLVFANADYLTDAIYENRWDRFMLLLESELLQVPDIMIKEKNVASDGNEVSPDYLEWTESDLKKEAQSYYREAKTAERKGDIYEAVDLSKKALECTRDDERYGYGYYLPAWPIYLRNNLRKMKDDYEKEAFVKAVMGLFYAEYDAGYKNRNIKSAKIHHIAVLTAAAKYYAEKNEYAKTVSCLKQALVLSPDLNDSFMFQVWFELAKVHKVQGNYSQALEAVDAAMKCGFFNRYAATFKADILIKMKRYEDAKAVLREIMFEGKQSHVTYELLAQALQLQGRLDEALYAIDEGIKINADAVCLRRKAEITFELGDFDASWKSLSALESLRGKNSDSFLRLKCMLRRKSIVEANEYVSFLLSYFKESHKLEVMQLLHDELVVYLRDEYGSVAAFWMNATGQNGLSDKQVALFAMINLLWNDSQVKKDADSMIGQMKHLVAEKKYKDALRLGRGIVSLEDALFPKGVYLDVWPLYLKVLRRGRVPGEWKSALESAISFFDRSRELGYPLEGLDAGEDDHVYVYQSQMIYFRDVMKDHEALLDFASQVKRIDYTNEVTIALQMKSLRALGRYQEALDLADMEYSVTVRNRHRIDEQIIWTYCDMGEKTRAFEEAMQLNDLDEQAQKDIGAVKRSMMKAILTDFDPTDYIEMNAENPAEKLGALLLIAGQCVHYRAFDDAIRISNLAIKCGADNNLTYDLAYYYLGTAYLYKASKKRSAGSFEEWKAGLRKANQCYDEALKIRYNNAKVYYKKAIIELELFQFDAAELFVEDAMRYVREPSPYLADSCRKLLKKIKKERDLAEEEHPSFETDERSFPVVFEPEHPFKFVFKLIPSAGMYRGYDDLVEQADVNGFDEEYLVLKAATYLPIFFESFSKSSDYRAFEQYLHTQGEPRIVAQACSLVARAINKKHDFFSSARLEVFKQLVDFFANRSFDHFYKENLSEDSNAFNSVFSLAQSLGEKSTFMSGRIVSFAPTADVTLFFNSLKKYDFHISADNLFWKAFYKRASDVLGLETDIVSESELDSEKAISLVILPSSSNLDDKSLDALLPRVVSGGGIFIESREAKLNESALFKRLREKLLEIFGFHVYISRVEEGGEVVSEAALIRRGKDAAQDVTPEMMLKKADQYYAEQNYEDAIGWLEMVCGSETAAPHVTGQAAFLLGSLLADRNDHSSANHFLKQAGAAFKKSEKRPAEMVRTQIYRARELVRLWDYSGAEKVAAEALENWEVAPIKDYAFLGMAYEVRLEALAGMLRKSDDYKETQNLVSELKGTLVKLRQFTHESSFEAIPHIMKSRAYRVMAFFEAVLAIETGQIEDVSNEFLHADYSDLLVYSEYYQLMLKLKSGMAVNTRQKGVVPEYLSKGEMQYLMGLNAIVNKDEKRLQTSLLNLEYKPFHRTDLVFDLKLGQVEIALMNDDLEYAEDCLGEARQMMDAVLDDLSADPEVCPAFIDDFFSVYIQLLTAQEDDAKLVGVCLEWMQRNPDMKSSLLKKAGDVLIDYISSGECPKLSAESILSELIVLAKEEKANAANKAMIQKYERSLHIIKYGDLSDVLRPMYEIAKAIYAPEEKSDKKIKGRKAKKKASKGKVPTKKKENQIQLYMGECGEWVSVVSSLAPVLKEEVLADLIDAVLAQQAVLDFIFESDDYSLIEDSAETLFILLREVELKLTAEYKKRIVDEEVEDGVRYLVIKKEWRISPDKWLSGYKDSVDEKVGVDAVSESEAYDALVDKLADYFESGHVDDDGADNPKELLNKMKRKYLQKMKYPEVALSIDDYKDSVLHDLISGWLDKEDHEVVQDAVTSLIRKSIFEPGAAPQIAAQLIEAAQQKKRGIVESEKAVVVVDAGYLNDKTANKFATINNRVEKVYVYSEDVMSMQEESGLKKKSSDYFGMELGDIEIIAYEDDILYEDDFDFLDEAILSSNRVIVIENNGESDFDKAVTNALDNTLSNQVRVVNGKNRAAVVKMVNVLANIENLFDEVRSTAEKKVLTDEAIRKIGYVFLAYKKADFLDGLVASLSSGNPLDADALKDFEADAAAELRHAKIRVFA